METFGSSRPSKKEFQTGLNMLGEAVATLTAQDSVVLLKMVYPTLGTWASLRWNQRQGGRKTVGYGEWVRKNDPNWFAMKYAAWHKDVKDYPPYSGKEAR